MSEFSVPTYMDFFDKESSFISLDISVNSSGIVCYWKGSLSYTTLALPEGTPASRRLYFRNCLLNMMQSFHWDKVYVEDVFGGSNFSTTRTLIELNCIVDDLKEQGMVNVAEIVRLDNKGWKKILRKVSNFVPPVKGMDDKEVIRGCLKTLSFAPPDGTPQDVYDALGIAIAGTCQKDMVVKKTKAEVSYDLSKGYVVKFRRSEEDVRAYLARYPVSRPWVTPETQISVLDFTSEAKDLVSCFTHYIRNCSDCHQIFLIKCRVSQIGALGLKFGASFPNSKPSDVVCALVHLR